MYYTAEVVMREASKLCERSLRVVLSAAERAPWGVGSFASLLPKSVKTVRPVLLFVRPAEGDDLYLQVSSYSLYERDAAGVAMVSVALLWLEPSRTTFNLAHLYST